MKRDAFNIIDLFTRRKRCGITRNSLTIVTVSAWFRLGLTRMVASCEEERVPENGRRKQFCGRIFHRERYRTPRPFCSYERGHARGINNNGRRGRAGWILCLRSSGRKNNSVGADRRLLSITFICIYCDRRKASPGIIGTRSSGIVPG